MSRKLKAEELREKARENLRKELARAKKIEDKENQDIGKKVREYAKNLGITPEELMENIRNRFSTGYPSPEPKQDKDNQPTAEILDTKELEAVNE